MIYRLKKSKKNTLNDIDLTSLYAYVDISHARDRELWRGFLSCVLPTMFPHHVDIIDQIICESLTDSVEDLTVVKDLTHTKTHVIRKISTHIAKSIGVSPEFALASFYNCEYDVQMPTKLYKFNYKPVKKQTIMSQEENMINYWLENFDKIRTDAQFLNFIENLKGQLD